MGHPAWRRGRGQIVPGEMSISVAEVIVLLCGLEGCPDESVRLAGADARLDRQGHRSLHLRLVRRVFAPGYIRYWAQ